MRLSDRRIMAKWGAGEGTQIASRYAELAFFGVATTARRGIFVRSAAPTPQPKNANVRILEAGTSDATSTESSCGVGRAETSRKIPSATVGMRLSRSDQVARGEAELAKQVARGRDTRHFAKIRVSQSDLRSKINHHDYVSKIH